MLKIDASGLSTKATSEQEQWVHVVELERGLVTSLPHVLPPTIHYLQGVVERVKEHTDWQHDPVLAKYVPAASKHVNTPTVPHGSSYWCVGVRKL